MTTLATKEEKKVTPCGCWNCAYVWDVDDSILFSSELLECPKCGVDVRHEPAEKHTASNRMWSLQG